MRGNLTRLVNNLRNLVGIHESYRAVFGTPDGEKVLRHLCEQGFVLKSTFVPGDPNQTAMNEGSRRLVLSILRFLGKDHDTLVKQLEEQMQKAQEDET